MTQMSTSAARVIDPILSTVARGFQNSELIGMNLFPAVPVAQRAGKIIQFGKEHFQTFDTSRAPGAAIKRLNIAYSSASYAIEDHSLGATVPVELMEEAQAVPGINLATASVNTVMQAMRLRHAPRPAKETPRPQRGGGRCRSRAGASMPHAGSWRR